MAALSGATLTARAGMFRAEPLSPAPARPTGYEADAHFPGAAALYAEEAAAPQASAAPGAGATGTTALPAVPQGATIDSSVQAARPFVMRGTVTDQARALQCLTSAVYYEAASEPDDGQSAVAQVVLNRVRHPAFPNSVCGVVYQGSERSGCQFSFACDGATARLPNMRAWQRARRAAARALAGYVYAPVGLATHYHTYAVTPAWNRTLVLTDMVGAHLFHRWKGWWGTAAAFSQSYSGHEPMPGPHPSETMVGATGTADVSAAVLRAASAATVAMVQPEHATSGTPLPRYAADDGGSQVLDRWKDSGKPLK